MSTNIVLLENDLGTVIIPVPDGSGGINYLLLNLDPYTGPIDNLKVHCTCSGEDAYQIAVRNGYVGTESEWLLTLIGQGVDHSSLTNTVSNVDTYTLWGDVGETIAIGTYTVTNFDPASDNHLGTDDQTLTEVRSIDLVTHALLIDGSAKDGLAGDPQDPGNTNDWIMRIETPINGFFGWHVDDGDGVRLMVDEIVRTDLTKIIKATSGTVIEVGDSFLPINTREKLKLYGSTIEISADTATDNSITYALTKDPTTGELKQVDLPAVGTDDQTAAEVPFTPAGNTTSTDVQAAIEEIQTEVDNLAAGGDDWGSQVVQSNATLTGDGTGGSLLAVANPYVVPDGSETKLVDGNNTVANGTGTVGDPYSIDASFENDYSNSFAFDTGSGDLTIGRTGALPDLVENLDGRYSTTDTQLTDEAVQDIAGPMVAAGTQTGITVTYDDAGNAVNFVVDGALVALNETEVDLNTLVTVTGVSPNKAIIVKDEMVGKDLVAVSYGTIGPGTSVDVELRRGTHIGNIATVVDTKTVAVNTIAHTTLGAPFTIPSGGQAFGIWATSVTGVCNGLVYTLYFQ